MVIDHEHGLARAAAAEDRRPALEVEQVQDRGLGLVSSVSASCTALAASATEILVSETGDSSRTSWAN
jgi:hypothetical protein